MVDSSQVSDLTISVDWFGKEILMEETFVRSLVCAVDGFSEDDAILNRASNFLNFVIDSLRAANARMSDGKRFRGGR